MPDSEAHMLSKGRRVTVSNEHFEHKTAVDLLLQHSAVEPLKFPSTDNLVTPLPLTTPAKLKSTYSAKEFHTL